MISAFEIDNANPQNTLLLTQREFAGATVQFVALDHTAGHRHILLATYNALKSHISHQMISRSLAIEILLYVAAERQISRAIARIGVRPRIDKIAVIAVTKTSEELSQITKYLCESFGRKNHDELLDEWTTKRTADLKRIFGVDERELKATTRKGEPTWKAIERLVMERSALLAVKR